MAGVGLRKFNNTELVLNQQEAWEVLRFFFPQDMGQITPKQMTDDDRRFAQGLLVEAIDSSYNMGYAEALFRSFSSPKPGVFSLVSFLGRAAKHWFTYAKDVDPSTAQIYEVIRLTLCQNWRTVWNVRLATQKYTGAWRP